MRKLPEILESIKDSLKSTNFGLSKDFSDGRINSSFNESEIIKIIDKNYCINVPKSRNWYDFSIEDGETFLPVNIKVTETKSADNLNCKLGIYYALTGLLPCFSNEINWLKYFEYLNKNIGKHNDRDYYFLVINKSDTNDVFINSLKGLSKLHNLPFQCKWDENRAYQAKSFEECVQFILTYFGKSIKLRAEIYFNFKKFFPEYV